MSEEAQSRRVTLGTRLGSRQWSLVVFVVIGGRCAHDRLAAYEGRSTHQAPWNRSSRVAP